MRRIVRLYEPDLQAQLEALRILLEAKPAPAPPPAAEGAVQEEESEEQRHHAELAEGRG